MLCVLGDFSTLASGWMSENYYFICYTWLSRCLRRETKSGPCYSIMTGDRSPSDCHLRPVFNLGCLFPPVFTCWKMDPLRQIMRIQPESGHVNLPHIYRTPVSEKNSMVQYHAIHGTVCNFTCILMLHFLAEGWVCASRCYPDMDRHIYTHFESPPCTSWPGSHLTWAANWTNRHNGWTKSRGPAARAWVRSR